MNWTDVKCPSCTVPPRRVSVNHNTETGVYTMRFKCLNPSCSRYKQIVEELEVSENDITES